MTATAAATNPFPTTRSDIPGLAGYILSRPTALELADLEEHFTRQWASSILAAAQDGGPDAYDRALAHVDREMGNRPCAYGTPKFDARATLPTNLPHLLWIQLRKNHPGITPAQAGALITDENRAAVREAVLSLLGFEFKPRAAAAAAAGEGDGKNAGSPAGATAPPTPGSPSTGAASGPTSASSGSPQAK